MHQDSGAAQVEGLLDLVVDSVLRQDVALSRFHGLVEIAERAVLSAIVSVVDVAINLVGDDALGMQLAPHGIRRQAEPGEVVAGKHFHGLVVAQHPAGAPATARTMSNSRPNGAKPSSA